MLQPKSYPEMLGKALVLEAEPFITMVDDDNPWAEGLFMVVLMGVLVGLAQIGGTLLTTAIMPHADALLSALLQIWRQIAMIIGPAAATGADAETWLRQWWPIGTSIFGYGWSWLQLGWLVLAPFLLVVQWLLCGFVTHAIARALGGQGKLTQTLGAVALMVAPQIFVLLEIVPFASVSTLLLWVWALLIVYRAIEVAHGLSWEKSAGAVLAAPAALILLMLAGMTVIAAVAAFTGGAV